MRMFFLQALQEAQDSSRMMLIGSIGMITLAAGIIVFVIM